MLAPNRVHIGDARELAGQLAPQSVNMICTSPPYFGLRSYLAADHPDKAREMGSEATPQGFVQNLVDVFNLLRPALRDDGTLWLNLGDSYAVNGGAREYGSTDGAVGRADAPSVVRRAPGGLKHKDLIGIPWRVALALQAEGWYLRSDIIWHKPNPMPESVRDRPTRSHEYLFLLSKKSTYYYDAEAIAEASVDPIATANRYKSAFFVGPKHESGGYSANGDTHTGGMKEFTGTRNKRDVWTVGTVGFPDAHFATFPPELVRPCIRAGTSERGVCAACGAPWRRVVEREATGWKECPKDEGRRAQGLQSDKSGLHSQYREVTTRDLGWEASCTCNAGVRPAVVLDPFAGSGTIAEVCVEEGRNWLGFDLDERSIGWHEGRLRALPVASLFAAT